MLQTPIARPSAYPKAEMIILHKSRSFMLGFILPVLYNIITMLCYTLWDCVTNDEKCQNKESLQISHFTSPLIFGFLCLFYINAKIADQGYIPKYVLTRNVILEIPLGYIVSVFCLSQTKDSYSTGYALLITAIIGVMLSTTRKESPQDRRLLASYYQTRKRIPTCDWDPDDEDPFPEDNLINEQMRTASPKIDRV